MEKCVPYAAKLVEFTLFLITTAYQLSTDEDKMNSKDAKLETRFCIIYMHTLDKGNWLDNFIDVLMMKGQFSLFLAYYLVMIQNRGVLEHLFMVFGIFCNVFYLWKVLWDFQLDTLRTWSPFPNFSLANTFSFFYLPLSPRLLLCFPLP